MTFLFSSVILQAVNTMLDYLVRSLDSDSLNQKKSCSNKSFQSFKINKTLGTSIIYLQSNVLLLIFMNALLFREGLEGETSLDILGEAVQAIESLCLLVSGGNSYNQQV